MEAFDFVVVGARPAGEAAAYLALARGAAVAVAERDLVGGGCLFFACMPSKTLLHHAAVHAQGGPHDWDRASARRDWMIGREGRDDPDDSGYVHRLRHMVLAVGSTSRRPPIEGLDAVEPWTNREATSTRELPRSLVVLGGGPTGVEMAQIFARYGVPVTIVELAVRMALGDPVRPDYWAIPRCTYTDPKAALVGLTLEGAWAAGHDAAEFAADLGTSAEGLVAEAGGHVTIVLDRASQELLGAAIAGPGASEAIHEAALAIKTRTPIDVLADTIHAFPTTSRVLGLLFADAARTLGAGASRPD